MHTAKRLLMFAATLAALAAAACSPEAGRKQGERGADIGNRPRESADVEIHGKSNPAHDVPTVGEGIKKETGRKQ